jgi:hypothetical protein
VDSYVRSTGAAAGHAYTRTAGLATEFGWWLMWCARWRRSLVGARSLWRHPTRKRLNCTATA